jgi:hypothetical protein
MTDRSLDALLRRMSRIAEAMFNKHGEIDPIWLLETASGEQLCLVSPIVAPSGLAAAEFKDVLAVKVREMFAELNVVRYARATECWLSSSLDGGISLEECERRYAAMGYTLENAVDRREAVVIDADDGREYLQAKREIVRPGHRRAYLGKLGEIERPECALGRFLDLLRRPENASV